MAEPDSESKSTSDADSDSESVAKCEDYSDSDPAFDHEYDRVRGQVRLLPKV